MANGDFYRPVDIYGTPGEGPEKATNGPETKHVKKVKATIKPKGVTNPVKGPKPATGIIGNTRRITTPNPKPRKPRKLRGTGY